MMMATFIESISIPSMRTRFLGISEVEYPVLLPIAILLDNNHGDAECYRKHMSPSGHTIDF